jgi:hypothetical protein
MCGMLLCNEDFGVVPFLSFLFVAGILYCRTVGYCSCGAHWTSSESSCTYTFHAEKQSFWEIPRVGRGWKDL